MNQERVASYQQTMVPWEPAKVLRQVGAEEMQLSRGFLRSRPDRWFPGFAAQWLPTAHALGCSLKIVEVKPLFDVSQVSSGGYAAKVDDELLIVSAEPSTIQTVSDIILPGVGAEERSLLTEYLARRLISSLASAWTGPQLGQVSFVGPVDSFKISGAVQIVFYLDDRPCTVWLGLGVKLIECLDGLWRRQVKSSGRANDSLVEVEIELAQIAVPLAGLSEYVRKGAVLDLGIAASDMVTLRCNNRPWLPGRLCQMDDVFVIETASGPVSSSPVADGATRLSVELGSLTVEAGILSELSQVGALWMSKLPLSNRLNLLINHEVIAQGILCTLGNRFVLKVS